jgi:flagellin-like hook-associated protein FlgL
LEAQFDKIIGQVVTMAEDSNYGGQNLIQVESGGSFGDNDLSVEFNEDGTNTLTVAGFSIAANGAAVSLDVGSGTTIDISAAASQWTDNAAIEDSIAEIDSFISQLRTEAQKLSSSLSTISIRSEFTNEMVNTLNTGADNLTLADMNEEGANMLMLQTRQNLGTTSLSLASQAAQAVLRLF